VTQGQPGYRHTTDGKHYKADANDTAAKAVVAGIFLTPAPTDGYAVLAKSGPVDLGATLAVGKMYVLSHTLGAIKPIEDLASTHYVTLLGVASTTSRLELEVDATGVQFA
jgi:hypothetical protein